MHFQHRLAALSALIVGMTNGPSQAQGVGTYFAPPNQVVAIRAGRLFDARSGSMMTNQIVIIKGDRITDVGAVQIPRGARVHRPQFGHRASRYDRCPRSREHGREHAGAARIAAWRMLRSISTPASLPFSIWIRAVASTRWIFAMRSTRASFRDRGCRSSANPSIQRAGNYYPDAQSVRFLEGFTENKNVNSPWLARAAVREAKLHGVDWIKIYTTQDFVGTDAHVEAGRDSGRHSIADAGGGRGDCG